MTEPAPRAGAEAARLLAAAQEWLRGSAPHLAPVDADGQTCPCPLCRAVAAVRDADPDTVARWVDGAVAAVEKVAADAATTAGSRGGPEGPGDPADQDHLDDLDDGDARADGDDAGDAPGAGRVRRIPIDVEPSDGADDRADNGTDDGTAR